MIILEPLLYHKYNTREKENLEFLYIDCKFEKEIIRNDRPYEGFGNGYASVVKINGKIMFYYRACNMKKKIKDKNLLMFDWKILKDFEYLCVAVSVDGLNFVKPKTKIFKFNNNRKNNIIRKDDFCHNFFATYDHNLKKYLGTSGTQLANGGIFLFESKDGYDWVKKHKILCEKDILPGWKHSNHYDSLNIILYNPVSKTYFLYTRHNNHKPNYRGVQLSCSKDLVKFSACRKVKMSEFGENNNIYVPGIFFYPGTNYFISHCCSQGVNGQGKIKSSVLMISNDGINFDLIKEEMISSIDRNILPVYGMIEINNNFLIYVLEGEGKNNNSYLCYSFKKDRIGCLEAKDIGSFKTHNIKSKLLEINYETEEDGSIDIEMYSKENELIERIENIKGDEMSRKIEFQSIIDDEIYFKFIMKKARIYSYAYDNS